MITFEQLSSLPIIREFYNLVWTLFGIKVVLRSCDGKTRIAIGDPPSRSPFCTALRQQKIGDWLCEECDREHVRLAMAKSKSSLYKCHAGLNEFIIPIKLNSETIGFLVTGQILDTEPNESLWLHSNKMLQSSCVDTSNLKGFFLKTISIPHAKQKDLVAQLELFANYVAHTHDQRLLLEQSRNAQIVARSISYIKENFSNNLFLEGISRASFTSVRNLSRIFRAETGMTVFEYIHNVRVKYACTKLEKTDKTCIQIANESGFGSIQQFNLVFKKCKNVTPKEWRRSK